MAVLHLRKRADGKLRIVGEPPKRHAFSDNFVARGLQDGTLELEDPTVQVTDGYDRNPVLTGKALVLKVKGGDVRYKIVRAPGKYEDGVSHEYQVKLDQGS